MLLDDVVDRLVALDERRPEVKLEDALDVIDVLRVPGLVQVVLAIQVRLDRGRHRALRDLEWIAFDLPHHHEREEDDQQDHRDCPNSSSDHELEHGACSLVEEPGGTPRRPTHCSFQRFGTTKPTPASGPSSTVGP